MKSTPPRRPGWQPPSRNSVRLTRRGRLVVTAACAMAVAGVIALTVTLALPDDRQPASAKTLTIPEGWRASQVYAAVDKALALPEGTTLKAVPKADLKLPAEAKGNPEGYLYPATYPVTKRTTPQSLLAAMVATAAKKFSGPVVTGARSNAMSVYQVVTIASVVQAEAATPADMGKVARIIYNRLARGMPLQMDSTINYALNRSSVHTTEQDTRLNSPYNSYNRMGLPPTPIGNPGHPAIEAAINPTAGDWLYFVTVKPGDTRFSSSYEEQMANVTEFNQRRQAARAIG
ncbi:endolytic transglycosylase MltG [Streptomyces odontomachi]|uniref:endolytic transglycosylase MltG n=1 Tax=Streptomyces odontomachi TaxID=2944940 RepID=UPI00210AB809|nr:endolytic transglycosylase MltG [Streptomyces sp. ODS25]